MTSIIKYPSYPAERPQWALNSSKEKVYLNSNGASGHLPYDVLWAWEDAVNRTGLMIHNTYCKFIALGIHINNLGRDKGIRLTFTSRADTYRTYPQQERVWRDRYQLGLVEPRKGTKLCDYESPNNNLRVWSHVKGATAACPGKSVHGDGCAIDVALIDSIRPHLPMPITSNPLFATWLAENAPRYGFCWRGNYNDKSFEPWHIENYQPHHMPLDVYALTNNPVGQESDCFLLQYRVNSVYNKNLVTDGRWGPRTQAVLKETLFKTWDTPSDMQTNVTSQQMGWLEGLMDRHYVLTTQAALGKELLP
jgi:hypothetical protein